MSQMFRTTLRLDLDKPASAQAASLLRQLHAERGLSYSALIVPAVKEDPYSLNLTLRKEKLTIPRIVFVSTLHMIK